MGREGNECSGGSRQKLFLHGTHSGGVVATWM